MCIDNMDVWAYLVSTMTVRKRNCLAWLVCLLFAVGAVADSPGGVLCVGEDGHVKYESICLPPSGGAADPCAPSVFDDAPAEYCGCGDCSDVPLDSPQWLKRPRYNSHEQRIESISTHPARLATSTWVGGPHVATGRSPCCQSPPDLSLKTVILLC